MMIRIGKDIKIQAQEFRGKTYIAVRRWYDDNGEEKPGRQGINFKKEEWNEFLEKLDEIKKDIAATDKE